MFLKSVELYGFKSFADRTKIEFSDGITSLLGPNGCGKSNVVDAVKWVLGNQSLSQIRAGKREDVIFNGSAARKQMSMCEVILSINNEDGILNVPVNEIEIKRRMFRNGDNEYYINREKVLLKTVRDLFLDTGVGKSAYSILEQGKIDQILSMKPEDRRYIFEEAAGISRYKQQSEEAAKKLEKTDENISQIEILLNEQEKIITSRKSQVDKVLKNRELTSRRDGLEVDIQLLKLQKLDNDLKLKNGDLQRFTEEKDKIDEILRSCKTETVKRQEDLEILKNKRIILRETLLKNEEQRSSLDREYEIFNDKYNDLHRRSEESSLKLQLLEQRYEKESNELAEKESSLKVISESISSIKRSIEVKQQEINSEEKHKSENLSIVRRLIEETDLIISDRMVIANRLSEIAGFITNRIEDCIKGSNYSVSKRIDTEKTILTHLRKMSSDLNRVIIPLKSTANKSEGSESLINILDSFVDSVHSQIDETRGLFQEYCGMIPTFLDEYINSEGVFAEKSSLDSMLRQSVDKESENRKKISELNENIEKSDRKLILMESDLNDLKIEHTRLMTNSDALTVQIKEMSERLNILKTELEVASEKYKSEQSTENNVFEDIESIKTREHGLQDRISSVNIKIREIDDEIDKINNELSNDNLNFREKSDRKQFLIEEFATCKAKIENINEQIENCYKDFFDSTGKSLKHFSNRQVLRSENELRAELSSVKKEIQDLGYINYLAEEEYNEAKKNYGFYKKNIDDLLNAKYNLDEILHRIRKKSEELFIDTFERINSAFKEMFAVLFDGGEAELSLDDYSDVLSSGIEIKAQPPGKKMTYLPLLSGGEKSMTAVALLLATYKVKPSPFCILDEIDAALDSKNIGSLINALDKLDSKSQFVIITHNKNTVLGSDTLLGITQQEAGVSKIVGYKLCNEQK